MSAHKLEITTLLYCFDSQGRVLLINRRRPPNRGLWSPPGGKLKSEIGESPYMCACREAKEEIGLHIRPENLHLVGIVSETNYLGLGHWLMFLFEVKGIVENVPRECNEGELRFFESQQIYTLPIPDTDREFIWPLFWEHRGGFFAVHCFCTDDGKYHWHVLESLPSKLEFGK